jgi:hypothetical protein
MMTKEKKIKEDHEAFKPPSNPDIGIWRYFSFKNLISILEYQGIFFPRLHHLGDPFEGSVTQVSKNLELVQFESLNLDPSKFQPEKMVKQYSEFREKNLKEQYFVSCWHMSDHESAAMWGLYAKNIDSIAIKSTFKKLSDNLPSHIFIGTVSYIDYEKDIITLGNIFHPIMHKRQSFEHEKELRAVVWGGTDGNEKTEGADKWGLWVPVKLENLIESIYISPTSPDSLEKLITKIFKRYGLNEIPIIKSKLGENPIF